MFSDWQTTALAQLSVEIVFCCDSVDHLSNVGTSWNGFHPICGRGLTFYTVQRNASIG